MIFFSDQTSPGKIHEYGTGKSSKMSQQYDVLVLTESRYISPENRDVYIDNVLLEDRLVVEALRAEGLSVDRVDWADPRIDWSSTSAVLFRTTWDYFERYEQFQSWMNQLPGNVSMINPESIIRWNIDKHYLLDLAARGINIPPTIILEAGDSRSLKDLQEETGWEDMILKPCISGGARNTFRLSASNLHHYEARYNQLIDNESFMIQPFQHSVLSDGELSLMVFGETYTHAVQKIAKPGDFRVQDDWGGTVHPYTPSAEEIQVALDATSAVSPLPAYARVDMIRDNEGQLSIMELELLEPELWFRFYPDAAGVFAKTIVKNWL